MRIVDALDHDGACADRRVRSQCHHGADDRCRAEEATLTGGDIACQADVIGKMVIGADRTAMPQFRAVRDDAAIADGRIFIDRPPDDGNIATQEAVIADDYSANLRLHDPVLAFAVPYPGDAAGPDRRVGFDDRALTDDAVVADHHVGCQYRSGPDTGLADHAIRSDLDIGCDQGIGVDDCRSMHAFIRFVTEIKAHQFVKAYLRMRHNDEAIRPIEPVPGGAYNQGIPDGRPGRAFNIIYAAVFDIPEALEAQGMQLDPVRFETDAQGGQRFFYLFSGEVLHFWPVRDGDA